MTCTWFPFENGEWGVLSGSMQQKVFRGTLELGQGILLQSLIQEVWAGAWNMLF